MFDYLKQVADKQHVPISVLSDHDTVIHVKTTPSNILVLQKLPLTNAEDIERYLEGLRQQLERLLVDQDGVMIIK